MTWWEAYLRQARSDYALYERLHGEHGERAAPVHDQLHYLQMACEKLAKAGLAWSGVEVTVLRGSHAALTQMIRRLKDRGPLEPWRANSRSQWRAFVDSVLPTAREAEQLAPAEAGGGPNPEYPWEAGGAVVAPCDYAWPSDPRRGRLGLSLLKLVKELVENFETYYR
ncbi:MAG: hypothetical protein HYU66_28940 [Armatimonadetes bacterium]|nr:hypothetical protein [Armatimonadota bacterium]